MLFPTKVYLVSSEPFSQLDLNLCLLSVFALPTFCKNPSKSVHPESPLWISDHSQFLITCLTLYHPPGDIDLPGLPSARMLIELLNQGPCP